jgi:DNA invertase Pin-like site-specific DNA recombinase
MWLASSGQLVALIGAAVTALIVGGVAAGRKSLPAALACVVLLGAVLAGGLRAHALNTGPVAELATEKAVVVMVMQVTSEPTRFQSRQGWGEQVRFRGDVLQIDGRGHAWAMQQAVSVEASGDRVDSWAAAMVGATVKFSGRLGTADVADGVAAVVRPLTPPELQSDPPWWMVAVERVRSGLRDAAASLPTDQRALVPALTLGDTSQVSPTMTDEFRATGLTHLMAVSGVMIKPEGGYSDSMRVLIYARVSHDDAGRARSVDEQVEDCEEWVSREGWEVYRVVREMGSASRYARSKRPEWAQVLEIIDSGTIDAVLTWEASRAQRDLAAYSELRDKCIGAGVKWGYSGRLYDFDDRDARFRTGLDALLAEDEAARTSERVKRAVRANAMAGRVHGKDLYGYRRIYDPTTRKLLRIEEHPEQAPIVKEVFARMYAGEGTYTIAGDLNRRNIPPRRPARTPGRGHAGWTTVAVHEVAVERPAYAGIRQFQGELLEVAVEWPALVDRAKWEELAARDRSLPGRNPADWRIRYLLTGIALCGVCSGKLHKGHQNKGRPMEGEPRQRYDVYVCTGMRAGSSAHVSVSLRALDELIVDLVLSRLSRSDALASFRHGDEGQGEKARELSEVIATDKKWLDDVTRAAADSRDLTMLIEQRKIVIPRMEANQRLLRSLTSTDPAVIELASAERVDAKWQTMSLDQQRRVVSGVLTPIVRRADRRGQRGNVHERVDIIWL